MIKNSKIDIDEINLIELMYTLWEGKWKIAVAVIISLIAVISYESTKTKTKKNFTAITEIKPVSTLELNKFIEFNNVMTNTNTKSEGTFERADVAGRVNKITSLRLLNIYINVLNNKSVFEDAIRKFNLLEASQYNNEQEYSEAIIRLSSSIKILPPSDSDERLATSYHTINFIHHDAEKWKSILGYVNEFTNKLVKKNLVDEVNNSLLFLTNQKKYQLEDISIKINNYLIDYEREISDQLAYLKEQSEIAKKLGIVKNTIEVQTFGNQNALLSNVQTDSPFYLRGYEAIDKEIELIRLRKDKKAFIKGLFKLEKRKREIEQDKTIERIKLVLQSNLLISNNQFNAASINTVTTKFEYKDNKIMPMIVIIIGLIVGILYVLTSNAFQSHRVSRKKTN
jgi:LPS O-antigen subunit length determinant protein (WzzB/FepE family)